MKNAWLPNWRTIVLVLVAFALPWQTRWMFGSSVIAGEATQFGIMSLYAVEVLFAVGVGFACVRDRAWFRVPAPMAIFGVGTLLSVMFAAESTLAFAAAIHIFVALALFLCLADRNVRMSTVIVAFCAGLLPAIALGLWQVIAGSSGSSTMLGLAARNAQTLGDAVVLFNGERVLRAYGTFPHPNIFGGFLAVAVVMWVSLRRQISLMIFWTMAGALAVGLVLTGSRSAMLGLGIAFAVMTFRQRSVRFRSALAVALLAAALVGVFAAPNVALMLRGGGSMEERSIDERREQYADYEHVLSSTNLLIGHGVGNYVFTLAEVFPDREWWQYQPIHNVPLLVFAEIGVLGFVMAVYASLKVFHFHEAYAVLAAVGLFDHYLWTTWSGLALAAIVMAFVWREAGEKSLDAPDGLA